jgi:iron complex outermembrane receptor protein
MTYLIDNTGLTGGGTPVTGGIGETSSRSVPSVIYGDTGPEKVTTDLMKFKLCYDINPALQAIFTAAYENRVRSQNNPGNYLRTAGGQPFFGGGALPNATTPGGTNFDVQGNGFRVSKEVRQTLQPGINLHGALTENWFIDTTTSHFNVLKDERARSNLNLLDR